MEGLTLASDLWRIGLGELSVDSFPATHGYHGPAEGEMSSLAWREDASPIVTLAECYAGRDAADHPRAAERDRARRRDLAEKATPRRLSHAVKNEDGPRFEIDRPPRSASPART